MSSSCPDFYLFHQEHLWLRLGENSHGYVGVSHFAQKQLGKLIYADLPRPGYVMTAGVAFGTVESNKTVSDLVAPISGEINEVNPHLKEQPGWINTDCYGEGWLVKVSLRDMGEVKALMSASKYSKLIGD